MFSPLEVHLARSRSLALVVLGSHVLAFCGVLIANIDPFTAVVLAFALSVSFFVSGVRWLLSGYADDITILRWNVDKHEINVQLRNGRWQRVTEIKSAAVLPYALVFRLELESYALPQNLVVFFDSTDKQSYRRLKVVTLHGACIGQVNPTGS